MAKRKTRLQLEAIGIPDRADASGKVRQGGLQSAFIADLIGDQAAQN